MLCSPGSLQVRRGNRRVSDEGQQPAQRRGGEGDGDLEKGHSRSGKLDRRGTGSGSPSGRRTVGDPSAASDRRPRTSRAPDEAPLPPEQGGTAPRGFALSPIPSLPELTHLEAGVSPFDMGRAATEEDSGAALQPGLQTRRDGAVETDTASQTDWISPEVTKTGGRPDDEDDGSLREEEKERAERRKQEQ